MTRTSTRRFLPTLTQSRTPTHSCSLLVLAALGLLGVALPRLAHAQAAGTPLPAGTLPVVRGVVAGQVVVNSPVLGASRPLLTIDQASQRAIIDWKSFNISSDAEVRFNQPSTTASVLNRIYSADPSIIQGKLTANGQVLLINQNGILFDRGSQVNVQSLLASTLNIRSDQFYAKDANGKDVIVPLTAGGLTTALAEGGYDNTTGATLLDANGGVVSKTPEGKPLGSIGIGTSGPANAAAPTITANGGGSIIIFAPQVENRAGLISAPDGQVILAAGGKAYLALADQADPTLRGFQIEVEAGHGIDVNLSSLVRNSGIVTADRGNVTFAALAINQNGRVSANTAVQANGSVFLKARTLNGAQAGTASFGAGSVTQVLPDTQDKSTLPESQNYASILDDRRGEIRVDAKTIASSGTLQATGGHITLTAREAVDAADPTAARVYLDSGSVTSVAGNWVDVPFADNLLTFKVTSNELRDAPDQKGGFLKGQTVTVDLRKGSPLLNLEGYIAAQARTVAQKTAVGGELDVSSTGSLIQRSGAMIDASGGGYRYGAGTASTSVLVGDDGRTYSITTAPEQRTYTGLLDSFTTTSTRWGQTQVFTGINLGLGQAEAGYVEGKSGGVIRLQSAAGLVLDGGLTGGVTVGPNQLAKAPRAASLTIGVFDTNANDFDSAQHIGNVQFTQTVAPVLGSGFDLTSALSKAQTENISLAADQLFDKPASAGDRNGYAQGALDSVEINANGRISVPEGVRIDSAPGSSLLLRSPQIDVAGAINMPAGNITLQPVSTIAPLTPDLGLGHNSVTVHSTASLSTAGEWINNATVDGSFVGDPLPTARLNIAADGTTSTTSTLNGGKLTIANTTDRLSATVLERGAVLDVGGGASLGSKGRVTAGDGGTLKIDNAYFGELSPDWLQADLWGLSPGNGGKLVLSTPRVVLDADGALGTLPSNTTRLLPGLFADRGFSSITVNTVQGIAIDSGATITLQQKNRVVDPVAAAALATGGDLHAVSSVQVLPDAVRKPVSLALATIPNSAFPNQATLTMAAGSALIADPKATVSLSAVDALSVNGRISAPGGNVNLALSAPDLGAPDLALGPDAVISVAGTFVRTPTDNALVQGTVIGGGTVTIAAAQTGASLAAGSQIEVSGITQTVQSLAADGNGVLTQAVDGNAGTLIVRSQGATQLDATLRSARGSERAAGGSFALEQKARDNDLTLPAERRIIVSQEAPSAPAVADPAFVDARVSITALQQAGFDKLRLQSEDRIELNGNLALGFARGIRLDAPLIDVTGNGRVSLQGTSVAIGQSLDPLNRAGSGPYSRTPQGVSPVLATRAGMGQLSVQADTIDLFGSVTLNGVSRASLSSDGDIRMTGRNVKPDGASGDHVFGTQTGSLTTAGNLTLSATQIYPSTRSDFTVSVVQQPAATPVTGGSITIASNGKAPGDVYSAGGRLALVADTIVQGGAVKAPLGEIDLLAGSSLELSPGSVTSVSAKGLTLPFGTTLAGLSWRYQDNIGGGTPNLLTTGSSDAKRIQMAGTSIDVRAGATVDVSGGGDVQASEFVPGIGGTKDTLIQPNTFAIIPKSKLSSLPIDTDLAARQDIGFGFQSAARDTSVYDRLYVGGGAAVPEGEYVLLPGRYALVPGAYLVQLQTGSAYANLQLGQTSQLANGQTVVAGYRTVGGTPIRESTTVGVLVRPGSAATRESDYQLTTSSYFTDLASSSRVSAPRVPIDAGRLAFVNAQSLDLSGSFVTAPGGSTSTTGGVGRIAEVDISADHVAVVDHIGDIPGIDASFLQLEGKALSALGASLLLGGQRSPIGDELQINTGASQIIVANSAAGQGELKVPELLLAASDSIEVRENAVLTGSSIVPANGATALKTEAGGALLRLSSGDQATVDRGGAVDNTHGEIRIATGATLNAARSLLLDATKTTRSQGRFAVGQGGDVSLASSQVSLGETAKVSGIDTGLVLSNTDLAGLADLDALRIKGYLGIDLYGNAAIGATTLGTLTLDAGALRGHSGDPTALSTVAAREVHLLNSGTQAVADTSASAGALSIDAERIVIGAGNQKTVGFDTVAMNASREVVADGRGALDVAGDWTVRTPTVGVAAGAVQRWAAVDRRLPSNPLYSTLTLNSSSGTAGTSTDTAAGGQLAIDAARVSVATTVQAHAGAITIAAHGAGTDDGIVLANGAKLDASGVAKDFHGRVVTADAGSVGLSAAAGAVTVAAGSTIDVSASGPGGNAGDLQVAAERLNLGGQLRATAAASSDGGRAELDLGSLDNFSALNSALGASGFTESIDLRLRSGDLKIANTDVVKARMVQLAADSGRIDVAGSLDATSARGSGSVSVWAANGLALAAGSRVLANGTSTDAGSTAAASDGGRVRLSTAGGSLDFDAASVIDVSPGAKGRTGSVTFGVTRDAADHIGATQLAGTVLGRSGGRGDAAEVVLEAQRSYNSSGDVTAADIAGYAADHSSFIAASLANGDSVNRLAGLKADGDVPAKASLHGTTEVRTSGDMNLAAEWDLTSDKWLADGRAGTLNLRAGGNLTMSNDVGSPNDNLVDGETWNLRLVGGADLTAANPVATRPVDAGGLGSVLLTGNNAKLRTGTGSIEVAAATDFVMDSPRSVVYTAGRVGAPDTAANGNNRWSRDGGNIAIRAGRDASGASNEWITEWLRRPRSALASTPAEWWTYRPNFQQGIGTLGGGDIRIDVGHDVNNLSAMLPTTGRSSVDAGGLRSLDVQGGGDLSLRAGNDVIGGSYLVGRGEGRITAGGNVGATAPTQLFVMGASSGTVPANAEVSIAAGESIELQSVNNPTALLQLAGTPGQGPSFGQGPQRASTFFTYSADSTISLLAQSGDIRVGSQMIAARRLAGSNQTVSDSTVSGAFPASLLASALEGNVSLGLSRAIVTYPSATAQAVLLAGGSVLDPNLTVSDRSVDSLTDALRPVLEQRSYSGADLLPNGSTSRIVDRSSIAGFVFDLQGLTGDVSGSGADASVLSLPAMSRVRAGRDVKNVSLTLQNLNSADQSEVRADVGDVAPAGLEIRGPGGLLIQAGRNIDAGASAIIAGSSNLGGIIATGNNANPSLDDGDAARLTLLAGVKGDVDLAKFKATYDDLIALNRSSDAILAFYRRLNGDTDRGTVDKAASVQELIAHDPLYAPYADLLTRYPGLLKAYQAADLTRSLPLGVSEQASQAAALYALLNRETDTAKIVGAGSVADLVDGTLGGSAYADFAALDKQYPRVFADYRARRSSGARPEGLTPIVLSDALGDITAKVVAADAVGAGNIYTFGSSIQTYGNGRLPDASCTGQCAGQGDIDLWAPGGKIIAGLTTPTAGTTIGVVTNGGGAIRSVVGGDFTINQGKVLTTQGGDILLYSSGGSIDAGRGARTSISTPPPTRTPITVDGVIVGYLYTVPASSSGSGIQTLSSDPDGIGPRTAAPAGGIYLFAPAGAIDAGEAGIRSGGSLFINAPTVLNASNFSAAGPTAGVPVATTGSLASSLATAGTTTTPSKSGDDAGASATTAARAAAAAEGLQKPTILTVEVLGFGDKNCKEKDKDCFAK